MADQHVAHAAMAVPGPVPAAPAVTGWLVFVLGETEYGVDVACVRQIIGLQPITRVPRMPRSVRGVINLRGRVLPVVDLRIEFDLDATDHGQRTCIIVVHAAGADVGMIVDRVVDVAHLPAAAIDAAPQFGGGVDVEYLSGVAHDGARVVLLLDAQRALARSTLTALHAAAPDAAD